MTFKLLAGAALALVSLHTLAAPASTVSDAAFAQVLQGTWRDPQNSGRDQYRHPQQTLQFFGLRPQQTVIEITPGNGWYSELLGPLLQDKGHYVAAVEAQSTSHALQDKFTADPAHYAKSSVVTFLPQQPRFGAAGSADTVLTFRNVHNWVMADTAPAMFKAFFKVLKHGGTLGVVDHRGPADESLERIKQSGYLPTAYVVKLATDAGFKLAGESEINANPKDTKDYLQGVWTLPPTLRLGEQDKAKYLAIGESDRMTLRFIKP
ncbi:methyltransferase [Pseudomonas sp. dw_358]|uniref:class I SAM-dependent methyltransferase n=1 Tax=Pseudomonas sp. dw_358 TaxID=2720083 RepID=UPI001BD47D4D|nr:methyltransferase [Pseudomonas sp. dw_358]